MSPLSKDQVRWEAWDASHSLMQAEVSSVLLPSFRLASEEMNVRY